MRHETGLKSFELLYFNKKMLKFVLNNYVFNVIVF